MVYLNLTFGLAATIFLVSISLAWRLIVSFSSRSAEASVSVEVMVVEGYVQLWNSLILSRLWFCWN